MTKFELYKEAGHIRVKSNCPHCYERGFIGWSLAGERILCSCLRMSDTLMADMVRERTFVKPSLGQRFKSFFKKGSK